MGKNDSGGPYYYPNKWARIVLTSAEEVVGERGVAALLNMANLQHLIGNYPPDNMKKEFPFEDLTRLQQALWDMYGPRGARVFAARAGEQSFQDGVMMFGSVAKAAQMAMRVGSVERRISIGLDFFGKLFNTVSDQKVTINEDDKHWYWNIERCPMCWKRESPEPVCHLAVGVLQAATAWASEGQKFRIMAIECHATEGIDRGVIKIEKAPIG